MARTKNIIGPQVRLLRYERELSQPALAARCQLLGWDISRDTIARIEGQTRWVGNSELVFLAIALDVPLHSLLPLNVRGNSRPEVSSTLRTGVRGLLNYAPSVYWQD